MAPKTALSQANGLKPKTSTNQNRKPMRTVEKQPTALNKPAQSTSKSTYTKAASIAGENPVTGVTSAYAFMANRIANRVAEMAESITFVERAKPQPNIQDFDEKRRPRKLEMRLNGSNGADQVAFSAPFLDNTLRKMLALQNRMLKSAAELSSSKGVEEKIIREQAAQSAELSRIIAMICAEKARQGA